MPPTRSPIIRSAPRRVADHAESFRIASLRLTSISAFDRAVSQLAATLSWNNDAFFDRHHASRTAAAGNGAADELLESVRSRH